MTKTFSIKKLLDLADMANRLCESTSDKLLKHGANLLIESAEKIIELITTTDEAKLKSFWKSIWPDLCKRASGIEELLCNLDSEDVSVRTNFGKSVLAYSDFVDDIVEDWNYLTDIKAHEALRAICDGEKDISPKCDSALGQSLCNSMIEFRSGKTKPIEVLFDD